MSQKIIAKIFNYAASEGADNLVIAKRSGQLILDCYFSDREKQTLVLPKKLEPELFASLRKIMSIAPGEFASQKYGRLPHKSGGLNFYLTILPENSEEKIIINIVKKPPVLWRLKRLGLQSPDLRIIQAGLKAKSGLIIASSPDNQGRSTTLNSLLLELSDENKSIYYLNNQTEYEIPGVASLDNSAANWDKLLRLDSEIIFADGLDDDGSLESALRAAVSGRLVLGTMKADSVWEVLEKIEAAKLPLKLKLDSLKIILNQRLAALKRPPRKNNRDSRQKIALFETLKVTPPLKKFLIESKDQAFKTGQLKLEKIAAQEGFRPLDADRLKKKKEGLI